MYAIFTAPNGKKYRRDAFWYQPFIRCDSCANNILYKPGDADFNARCSRGWRDVEENLDPNSPDAYLKMTNTNFPWRIRFAPPQTGNWTYTVYVSAPGYGMDTSENQTFTVTSSSDKGFIVKDTACRYFRYRDDGSVFIPLGLNCIRGSDKDTLYNRIALTAVGTMVNRVAQYGGNFLRTMMGPENFGIEWLDDQGGTGLGDYVSRQNRALDLDSVLKLAENNNIYLQLAVSTADEIGMNDKWEHNPYNAANVGGCTVFKDSFFTLNACKNAFKQRLRYIIARWGYSPHIFGYELIQEINMYPRQGDGSYWSNHNNVKEWYAAMINYGRSLDSNHLYSVSTTTTVGGKFALGGGNPQNSLYGLPELDFIEEHYYFGDYNANFQLNYISRTDSALFPKKPMMFGEMGPKWGDCWLGGNSFLSSTPIYDKLDWHNSLWSTLFGGTAGPGLLFGNTNDMLQESVGCWGGQYRYLKPMAHFLQDEPIFLQQPQHIANPCTGKGPKDYLWYNTASSTYAQDTTYNKCSCFSRIHTGDTIANARYTGSGISTTQDSLIEVFALKTNNRVVGWLHHKRNYWYEVPHGAGSNVPGAAAQVDFIRDNNPTPMDNNIPILTGDTVAIAGLAAGNYQVSFYSTWPEYEVDSTQPGEENGGEIPMLRDTILVDCDGVAKFEVPQLRFLAPGKTSAPYAPDYGFKLSWIGIDPPAEITANTIWNVTSYLPRSVAITSGTTLTISNCTIHIPADSSIKVMPGGKLIIDNATITSGCTDELWYGIEAWGTFNQPQIGNYQAVVEIKNGAVIEHARRGITNYKEGDLTKTGGIIKATGSVFRNNNRSVDFMPYQATSPIFPYQLAADKSYFSDCTFALTNDYKGDATDYPFDCHVALYQVNGLSFSGCNFVNNNTGLSAGIGYGIRAWESGFKVLPSCTGNMWPCNGTLIRSAFEGFLAGIYSSSDLPGPVPAMLVDQTDFTRNSVGVHIQNQDHPTITRCSFEVGKGTALDNLCFDNIGISTENVHHFRIESNDLIGNNVGGLKNVGIVTRNSGSDHKVIYNNIVSGLTKGCWAMGINVSATPLPQGLHYRCNAFENNEHDIYITPNGLSAGFGNGIAGAEGNTFTSTTGVSDITNYGLSFTYKHNGGTTEPINITGLVNKIYTGTAAVCFSDLTNNSVFLEPETKSQLIEDLPSLRQAVVYRQGLLSAAVDNGDTEGLLSYLQSNPELVYDSLINLAPYTSEHVLRTAASQEWITGEALQNVLEAHPEVLRSPGFIEFMFDNEHLPTEAFGDILDAAKGSTERASLEAALTDELYALGQTYTYLFTHIKNDSLFEDRDSIPVWLEDQASLSSAYELVGYYSWDRNFTAAESELSSIATRFGVDGEDYDEHDAYEDLYEVFAQLREDGRTVLQLTTTEQNKLSFVLESFPSQQVSSVASTATDWIVPVPRWALCTVSQSMLKTAPKSSREQVPVVLTPGREGNAITVSPNPAHDFVIFDCSTPLKEDLLQLTIINIFGQVVHSANIISGRNLWNTVNTPPGYYIYKVRDAIGTIATGRIAIVQ